MTFRPYMHIEKFGNDEVEDIELGQCYIFPKLDGTNASIWASHGGDSSGLVIATGSRSREITPSSDNAGFSRWVNENQLKFHWLDHFSQYRLYGEWLVPHSFKGYREDAWRKFYIFDVFNDETQQYLSYDAYKPLLDEFGLDYIPPLAMVKNGRSEHFMGFLERNKFLCLDDGPPGEGIVIKNYDYYNKYGRQTWAKIVRQEFKELHTREMGAPELNPTRLVEDKIVAWTVTEALIDKTHAKIQVEKGWNSRNIPELLDRVFYDIIKEELWDAWKEQKFGAINGKTLRALTIQKIKQMRPELFK